jgi:benzoyl-CoA reductase subunit BamC
VKKVKAIKIDADKCCGCRTCEVVCSTVHSTPKYSAANPDRSRIRVTFDPLRNIAFPMMAGPYTEAECNGRYIYTIDGKTYDECAFCRASCPSRGIFKEPDSGLPLKCDMCEGEPNGPMCVQWCLPNALTYEEREEEGEKEGKKTKSSGRKK